MSNPGLIPRAATNLVAEHLSESRAVALVGPRQSGKSTLARELLRPIWPAQYITLDDEESHSAALDDPTGFIASINGPAIIDEIQRAPRLMLAIKIRLDNDNTPGQFLLTGSADVQRIRTVEDALPGRVIYQPIWPLTQAEIEGREVEFVPRLLKGEIPHLADVAAGVDRYLDRFARGGFPGPLKRTRRARDAFFESYITSVSERDVPDLSEVRSLDGPAKMLRLVAARSAMTLNVASLARDLGIDVKTAGHHIRILRDLMLVRVHTPWFANLGSRQSKAPKLYVSDTGLMAALTGADPQGMTRNPMLLGSFLETAVCMEIVRLLSTSDGYARIYHYRDKKQREVDVILERPDGRVVGIEVKASASATAHDFRALRYLRDGLGDRFLAGVLLHAGGRTTPFGDRLAAVPIEALWT